MRHRSTVFGIMLAALLALRPAPSAAAQEFSLQVGPPIAAIPQPAAHGMQKASKSMLFVVRPVGCADAGAARITGTAEGIVDGVRRRLDLALEPLATPGVHAAAKGWAESGTWIVSLVGTCGDRTAGVLVSLGPRDTYRREAVQAIAGAPTPAQIDAALQTTGR